MITNKVRRLRLLTIALALLATLLAVRPALAIDGQLTIAQGAFTTFPIALFQTGGSYVLTSNLTVTTCSDAIDIKTSDVTINLNGFSIVGAKCGTGIGINALGNHLITIYNGMVSNFGGDGISLGHSSTVYGVRAFGNSDTGIACLDGCQIFNNIVNNNGGNGISVPGSARVSNNVTQFNTVNGIGVGDLSLVLENTADNNGANGILADVSQGGSLVRDNTACANGQRGLSCLTSNTGYTGNQFTCVSAVDTNGLGAVSGCHDLGHNL